MMTDYFCPASWHGVATHPDYPGVVVCVKTWAKDYSGRIVHQTERRSTGKCSHCNGTGHVEGAPNLREAREHPERQHFLSYCAEQGGRALIADVVSPLHYFNDGSPMCLWCSGNGEFFVHVETDKVIEAWPTFHDTPKGWAWHVEVNGQIVGKGKGLNRICHTYGSDKADPSAERMVDEIEAAVKRYSKPSAPGPGAPRPTAPSGPAQVTHECDWTWVKFPSKPPQEQCDILKVQFRARFSGKRMAWYITYPVDEAEIVAALEGRMKDAERLRAGRLQQMAEQAMERAAGIA